MLGLIYLFCISCVYSFCVLRSISDGSLRHELSGNRRCVPSNVQQHEAAAKLVQLQSTNQVRRPACVRYGTRESHETQSGGGAREIKEDVKATGGCIQAPEREEQRDAQRTHIYPYRSKVSITP